MQCGVQLGHLWPVLVNGCVTGAPSRKSPMNKQRAPSAEQRSAQLCRSLLSQAKPPSWPCNTAIVKSLELCVLTYCPWQDSIYIMLPMAHWWCVASVWGERGGVLGLWQFPFMLYPPYQTLDKSDKNKQIFNSKNRQNEGKISGCGLWVSFANQWQSLFAFSFVNEWWLELNLYLLTFPLVVSSIWQEDGVIILKNYN